MTANEQRAMHCSFIEQQKLLALTNEEKLFKIQLKGKYNLFTHTYNNICVVFCAHKLLERAIFDNDETTCATCDQVFGEVNLHLTASAKSSQRFRSTLYFSKTQEKDVNRLSVLGLYSTI